jgi:hypothetical protein
MGIMQALIANSKLINITNRSTAKLKPEVCKKLTLPEIYILINFGIIAVICCIN